MLERELSDLARDRQIEYRKSLFGCVEVAHN